MTQRFDIVISGASFAGLALAEQEFRRSVTHLFPAAEQAALAARTR